MSIINDNTFKINDDTFEVSYYTPTGTLCENPIPEDYEVIHKIDIDEYDVLKFLEIELTTPKSKSIEQIPFSEEITNPQYINPIPLNEEKKDEDNWEIMKYDDFDDHECLDELRV